MHFGKLLYKGKERGNMQRIVAFPHTTLVGCRGGGVCALRQTDRQTQHTEDIRASVLPVLPCLLPPAPHYTLVLTRITNDPTHCYKTPQPS